MGAASSEKYASLPQEQSIDNVPHSAALGLCTTEKWQPRAAAPASSNARAARTIWNGPTVLTPNKK